MQTYKTLNEVSNFFIKSDLWLIEFKKWFNQKDSLDIERLKQLAKSELISEEQNMYKHKLDNLIWKMKNLQVDSNFCEELYECVIARVHNENLNMLFEYYSILIKFGKYDLSRKFKREIKLTIDTSPNSYWDEISIWGLNDKNIFHRYLRFLNFKKTIVDIPSLEEVLECYILDGSRKRDAEFVIRNSTIDQWRYFIWQTVPNNPKIKDLNLFTILKCILEIEESKAEARERIDQILKEKSEESDLMKQSVDFLNDLLSR